MNDQQRQRARDCIIGALVSDAATMGLHWVYSQRRIAELVPENPEFREPDEADYEGGVGYFAHEGKHAGDFSHYGEQMLVMLHSLSRTAGRYQKAHYQEAFRRHFGYGGAFVGYIDRPTRQTLDRIYADENAALNAANEIAFDGDAREKQGMLTKVLAAVKRLDGQPLRDQIGRYADASENPAAALQYGFTLLDALAASSEFPGAVDEQLPAVSKLPPLVACHADDPDLIGLSESAIKVTNNTPRALDFGRVCVALLRSAVLGESRESVIQSGVAAASPSTRDVLERALAMEVSAPEAAREFGLHCDLGAGVPSLLVNLRDADSFSEAIRSNIYAGGDNCGRAIVLGGVCGALFGQGGAQGIPDRWRAKMRDSEAHTMEIDGLMAARD